MVPKKTGGRFEGAQKSALYKKGGAVSKKKIGRVLQFRYQNIKRPQSIYMSSTHSFRGNMAAVRT